MMPYLFVVAGKRPRNGVRINCPSSKSLTTAPYTSILCIVVKGLVLIVRVLLQKLSKIRAGFCYAIFCLAIKKY